MTIFTRGYRRYEGTLDAKGARWMPIFTYGYADAIRGTGHRVLSMFILIVTVILGFLIYFNAPMLTEMFLDRGGDTFSRMAIPEAEKPSRNLQGAILVFDMWTTLFVMLLTLFSGAGLVSDDLKARALPLYLARPITPVDYYVGKLLILVRLLARAILYPMLGLVLLAALLRPSDEIWDFLLKQDRLVLGILAYFAVLAISYGSLALLFSALSPRRISAIVLGAVVFLGGTVVRAVLTRTTGGTSIDALRALSLGGDTTSVLWSVVGREPPKQHFPPLASPTMAVAAALFVAALAALVVLRRARTVEVVS